LLNGEQLPNEQLRDMQSESKVQLSVEVALALALADAGSQKGTQATSIPTANAETIRFMAHLLLRSLAANRRWRGRSDSTTRGTSSPSPRPRTSPTHASRGSSNDANASNVLRE